MNAFYPGDLVRLYVTDINTSSGGVVDPTSITCSYKPAGTATVTTVTTSGSSIVKDSSGHYHTDLSIASTSTAYGVWYYRWAGTGTAQFAKEAAFRLLQPNVST